MQFGCVVLGVEDELMSYCPCKPALVSCLLHLFHHLTTGLKFLHHLWHHDHSTKSSLPRTSRLSSSISLHSSCTLDPIPPSEVSLGHPVCLVLSVFIHHALLTQSASYLHSTALFWIWLLQIQPEQDLAKFRNSNPAGHRSRFGKNLLCDHRTIRLMKLMVSTMLSVGTKS